MQSVPVSPGQILHNIYIRVGWGLLLKKKRAQHSTTNHQIPNIPTSDYFPSKQLHVSILWLLETTPASVYKALLNGTLTSLVSTDNDFVYMYVHTPIDLCNARMAYLSKVWTGISWFLVQIYNSTCSTTFFFLSYACISNFSIHKIIL